MKRQRDLDHAIQEWSAAQEPDDASLELLHRQISAALHSEELPHDPTEQVSKTQSHWRGRLVWFGLGVAVALLLAFSVTRNRPANAPEIAEHPPRQAGDLPPEFTWLAKSQLANKSQLLAEMRQVFSDKVAWIAETGGQVRIGLAPDDGFSSSAARRLAIRLVVTRTGPDSPSAHPVWAVDIISLDEQLVQLSDEAGSGDSLRMWTYCLPGEDQIAVDANVLVPGTDARQTTYSSVQQIGVPQCVSTWQQQGATYQVFQTVAYLEPEVL